MVKEKTIITIDNKKLEIDNVDTICVHGDTPTAVELVTKIREVFKREGIEVCSFSVS